MSRVLCQSLLLAGAVSSAIALHVVAATKGFHGFSWWPLLPPLLAYGLAPLPLYLFLAARSVADNVFDDEAKAATVQHWAEFTGASLLTLVLGLPLVLWHAGSMDGGGAALTLGGIALTALSAGLGVLFSRLEDSDSWGGGVSLLSS